jgi:hypothetical protein
MLWRGLGDGDHIGSQSSITIAAEEGEEEGELLRWLLSDASLAADNHYCRFRFLVKFITHLLVVAYSLQCVQFGTHVKSIQTQQQPFFSVTSPFSDGSPSRNLDLNDVHISEEQIAIGASNNMNWLVTSHIGTSESAIQRNHRRRRHEDGPTIVIVENSRSSSSSNAEYSMAIKMQCPSASSFLPHSPELSRLFHVRVFFFLSVQVIIIITINNINIIIINVIIAIIIS